MLYFQLMGGLGNQMFQYAAARSVSVKRSLPFKLDFDCPYPHIKYRYSLDVFKLEASIATARELLTCKPKRRVLKRLYRLVGADPDCRLYREEHDFAFQPGLFSVPDGSYVHGFWQTEKYFRDIADVIRGDFTFRDPPAAPNREVLEGIQRCQSVSLHVRRGDYVNVASTNKAHGVCSPEYYAAAVAHIGTCVDKPVFYVFSDDIDWAKTNLRTAYDTVFVDSNRGARHHEDMRLMAACKHHIIANSSFSWWGAWLNPRQDKIVTAPKRWVADPNVPVPDLIPGGWIQL